MIRLLIRNWWLLLLRGILAIAFAIFIFVFLPFVPAPLLRATGFCRPGGDLCRVCFRQRDTYYPAAVRGAGQGGSSWLMLADGIAVTTGGVIILVSPGLTLAHVIQIICLTMLVVGSA